MQAPHHGNDRRGLRLLGFPTTVRPGFPLFVALIAFLYPWPLGAWVAASIAVFTVVHELGHAVVARMFGCDARISLDFMVAYATFSPAPGFTRTRRALVALSGAGAQVTLAVAILLLAGVNPLSREDIVSSDASVAVWWTGIALGVVNLIPVTPLDGGAVVANLLDAVWPERGQRIMLRASIVITSLALATLVITGTSRFLFFIVFLLYLQWRTLRAESIIEQAVESALAVPSGIPAIDAAAAGELLDRGDARAAVAYSREAWMLTPSSEVAVAAARASAAAGDMNAAMQWLDAATRISLDLLDTHARINAAGEFDPLRSDPAFVAYIERLAI